MPLSEVSLRRLIDEGVVTVGQPAGGPAESGAFFGFPPLDTLVPKGLDRSLHLFDALGTRGAGAAAGFIVSILFSLCSSRGDVLWIGQSLAQSECGRVSGQGMQAMGLDPARILQVEAGQPADVLWAVEEGLGSGAVRAVVGELHDAGRALDLTASRRIALRSEQARIPAYLLLTGDGGPGATAARTRWRVSPAPSRHAAEAPTLLGAPVWHLEIAKNRDGPCAERLVGFCPQEGRFFEPADPPRRFPARAPARPGEAGARGQDAEVIDLPRRAPRGGRRP